MKNIIHWFLGCLMIATLTTCNREKHLPVYTIEGNLYEDCDRRKPVADATIQMIQVGTPDRPNGSITLGEVTTGSDGSFKLDYKNKSYFGATYKLFVTGRNIYMTLKESGKRITHKGDLFLKNLTNLNITFLKGQNSYTSQDTLYYGFGYLDMYLGGFGTYTSLSRLYNIDTDTQKTITIPSIKVSRFSDNKGLFFYAIGWQNYLTLGREVEKNGFPIVLNDCDKNQSFTIQLP